MCLCCNYCYLVLIIGLFGAIIVFYLLFLLVLFVQRERGIVSSGENKCAENVGLTLPISV